MIIHIYYIINVIYIYPNLFMDHPTSHRPNSLSQAPGWVPADGRDLDFPCARIARGKCSAARERSTRSAWQFLEWA